LIVHCNLLPCLLIGLGLVNFEFPFLYIKVDVFPFLTIFSLYLFSFDTSLLRPRGEGGNSNLDSKREASTPTLQETWRTAWVSVLRVPCWRLIIDESFAWLFYWVESLMSPLLSEE
jgi:hypothetical protein